MTAGGGDAENHKNRFQMGVISAFASHVTVENERLTLLDTALNWEHQLLMGWGAGERSHEHTVTHWGGMRTIYETIRYDYV